MKYTHEKEQTERGLTKASNPINAMNIETVEHDKTRVRVCGGAGMVYLSHFVVGGSMLARWPTVG